MAAAAGLTPPAGALGAAGGGQRIDSVGADASVRSESVAASVISLAPAGAAIASAPIVEPSVDPGPDGAISIHGSELPPVGTGQLEVGDSIGISLPREAVVGGAEVTDGGLVVYPGEQKGDVSVAVGVADDGKRGPSMAIHTVIPSADSPREYTYDISGARPIRNDDGSVSLVGDDVTSAEGDKADDPERLRPAAQRVMGSIARPWAADAHGAPVPTHFAVRGGALVQTVDFKETTAFPVVADPSVKLCDFWTAYCVKLSRSETRSINDGVFASGLAAASQVCSFIPLAGWGVPVRFVCAAAVAGVIWAMRSAFSRANRDGACVELKWGIVPTISLRGWKVVSC